MHKKKQANAKNIKITPNFNEGRCFTVPWRRPHRLLRYTFVSIRQGRVEGKDTVRGTRARAGHSSSAVVSTYVCPVWVCENEHRLCSSNDTAVNSPARNSVYLKRKIYLTHI